MAARKPVRLLIVGTGGMAGRHAERFLAIPGVSIVAGVDTNADRLKAYRERFGIGRGFASLDDALDWGQFDAAANVTPDGVHYATTMPLLRARKHVFCEKPLAVNRRDAAAMAKAADRAGVVHGVNLTYREGTALQLAQRMVAEGAIGEIRHIEASYLQSWLTQPAWGHWDKEDQWLWRLSTAHGSKGVLGDVGIHILDFATFAAGQDVTEVSCRLKTFHKAPGDRIGKYVLDANDSCAMHVALANGAIGVVHASRFASGYLNQLSLKVFGVKGGIEVIYANDRSTIRVCREPNLVTATWEVLKAPKAPNNYQRFIAAIRGGAPMDPDFHRGAALQAVLDRAVESDGRGGRSLKV